MKQAEIKVGHQYQAKVSGRIVVVHVDAIRETTRFGKDVTVYDVTNLGTGRKLTFKSAAKFRREVQAGIPVVSVRRTLSLEELGMTMPSAGKQ